MVVEPHAVLATVRHVDLVVGDPKPVALPPLLGGGRLLRTVEVEPVIDLANHRRVVSFLVDGFQRADVLNDLEVSWRRIET